MTPKQTALIQVAKLITAGIAGAILASVLFTYFTVAEIGIGFCAIMLAYLIKMVYDLEVAKAEHLESLNKMK